jgi:hypothetical protein
VLGVVIYVRPVETDYLAPSGIKKFAVADYKYNIIFGRIFGDTAYSYGNTLLLAEQNGSVLVAHDLKVDQKSSKIFIIFVSTKSVLKPNQMKFLINIFQGHLIAPLQRPSKLQHAQHPLIFIFLKVRLLNTFLTKYYFIYC